MIKQQQQPQEIWESTKKGLAIFFLKAALNKQELHEVIKIFQQDFKDERAKQEMLREYDALQQLVRFGSQ